MSAMQATYGSSFGHDGGAYQLPNMQAPLHCPNHPKAETKATTVLAYAKHAPAAIAKRLHRHNRWPWHGAGGSDHPRSWHPIRNREHCFRDRERVGLWGPPQPRGRHPFRGREHPIRDREHRFHHRDRVGQYQEYQTHSFLHGEHSFLHQPYRKITAS